MKKTLTAFLMALVIILGSTTAPAVIAEEQNKTELPEPVVLEDVDLALWEGSWNNMSAFLKHDELQPAFAELAEKEEITEEEARVQYKNKRRCEFASMIITEDSIAFRDGLLDEKNSDTYHEAKYEYKESYSVKHGNFDLEWHVFVSEDEGALYPNMLLMEIHGEELLTHFHLRFGKEDIETLLKMEDWYPTFIGEDSTYEQLADEICE